MKNNDIVVVTNEHLKTFGKAGVVLGFNWDNTVSVKIIGSRKTYTFKRENLRVRTPALCIGDHCIYGNSEFLVVSFFRGGYGINKTKTKHADQPGVGGYFPRTVFVPASMVTRISEVDFVE